MSAVIKVENIGKLYRLGEVGTGTLSHDLNRWWARMRGKEDPFAKIGESNDRTQKGTSEYVWALKNINFDIEEGEVLGIIGRNGAGKSTLLKILSKVTRPTEGNIKVRGRIASLLEVGTGFHPELSGRDNIYLNGAILGMTKAMIKSKFDEIVDFSGVERYIDTPVKRYSSGMYVRLAFAVAAFLECEILIVDEVLAVGDIEFQKKCLGKMKDVSQNTGRTVIFVSHELNAISSICRKGVLMHNGSVAANDTIDKVIAQYLSQNINFDTYWENPGDQHNNPYFKPTKFYLVKEDKQVSSTSFGINERIGVVLEGMVTKKDPALTLGFAVFTTDQKLLFWSNHTDGNQENWIPIEEGHVRLIGWIPRNVLNEGNYKVELMTSVHYKEWITEPGKNAPIISLDIAGGLDTSPYWQIPRPGIFAPLLTYEKW